MLCYIVLCYIIIDVLRAEHAAAHLNHGLASVYVKKHSSEEEGLHRFRKLRRKASARPSRPPALVMLPISLCGVILPYLAKCMCVYIYIYALRLNKEI